jgi:hypothetical protein
MDIFSCSLLYQFPCVQNLLTMFHLTILHLQGN